MMTELTSERVFKGARELQEKAMAWRAAGGIKKLIAFIPERQGSKRMNKVGELMLKEPAHYDKDEIPF